jgi:hypothetical protein
MIHVQLRAISYLPIRTILDLRQLKLRGRNANNYGDTQDGIGRPAMRVWQRHASGAGGNRFFGRVCLGRSFRANGLSGNIAT